MIDHVMIDIRRAIRGIRRAPSSGIVAILTLALGIGLSTAVFTVADALLLRDLPVTDQHRIAILHGATADGRFANFPMALDDLRSFERRARSLERVAFFSFRGATPAPVGIDARVETLKLSPVSGNFFDVLGATASHGRGLRDADDVPGAAPVVVLSHRAWIERFGSDPAIVGRTVTMTYTGLRYRVVGVMPQGLDYPRGTDLWTPVIAYGAAGGFLEVITGELDILARLRPDASVASARGELSAFFASAEANPVLRDMHGVATPLADVTLGDTKPALVIVSIAVALLLAITCVNVANLLLVRALSRIREFAVRSALGAGRARIVRQLLAEAGVLALGGGIAGIALAALAIRGFTTFAPATLPRVDEVNLDVRALLAALVITTMAMLAASLGPLVFTSRMRSGEVLRAGTRNSGSRGTRAAAEWLTIAQVAFAATSLVVALLVARSLIRLQTIDLTFDSESLIAVPLAVRGDRVSGPGAERAAFDEAVAAVAALPGVQEVTPVVSLPFIGAGGGIDGRLALPGQRREEWARNPLANMEVAAPNYFRALGIPLIEGRAFTDADREGTVPVVIVSRSVARHFWPQGGAVGKRLAGGNGDLTIVGVVPDTRYRELTVARPSLYFPRAQAPFGGLARTLVVRATGNARDLIPSVRRAIGEGAPGVAVMRAESLRSLLDGPRAQPRLNAMILALFAGGAVSLAMIGLFATIATMVRQRTGDFGIRMAVGATAVDIARLVIGRGVRLALVGVTLGIAGALAASRLVVSLLYETSAVDAATIGAVATVMFVLALIASVIPARASMRIEPLAVLRSGE